MNTTIQIIIDQCYQALCKAYPLHSFDMSVIEVTLSTQDKFGHYQCNSAMKLSKELKLNPREIATKLVEVMDQNDTAMFAKIEIAGPGFINFTLSSTYLEKRIANMLIDSRLGMSALTKPEKIVIDFSSPNIAKEMHVGHLRSTIIGDSLARLFEFLGHDVLRLNHVGDWGTAFGMLIAYLKQYHSYVLSQDQETDLSHLVQWYRAAKKLFDEDVQFKKTSQQEVVALQSGEAESLRAWQLICDISRQAYQVIYDLLDIHLIERGESYYNPLLTHLIADLEEKNMITHSDGAKCIYLDGFVNRDGEPLPLMVQKSDGGFNYASTDMAAICHRIQEEQANRIIYVTDLGQATHFQMIFKAAEKAGYLNPDKVRVDHVGFGLVLGADGKKFKTRSGETERLIDLLSTAIARAKSILLERQVDMDQRDLEQAAVILGINAIKYADLSCNRTADYTFSYERMLRFEGNTAAFLMYAYVRIQSIKRKIEQNGKKSHHDMPRVLSITLVHPSEIALANHLDQFVPILFLLANELLPHRLTDYLYQLAERFNAFFRDCRVEGDEQQASRLLLLDAVSRVMARGFYILGLRLVERM